MRFRGILTLLLSILVSGTVWAQEEAGPEPEAETKPNTIELVKPCAEASVLLVNNPAPCSGILWPYIWSRKAIECITVDLPQLQATCDVQEETLVADLQSCQTTLAAARAQEINCKEATHEVVVPETPWWKHPIFWGVVGAAAAAGTTALVYELVD